MLLYIVRHGPAGSPIEFGGPDSERPLTSKGAAVMGRVAKRLVELEPDIDAIITSPYVRARQTAEIIARALGATDRLEEDARLLPGFGPAELMGLLADYSAVPLLAIVGHEPDLSEVLCHLTGASHIDMKKGAVALVQLSSPSELRAHLLWLAPPKVLAPRATA